jgi:hypothetical protein
MAKKYGNDNLKKKGQDSKLDGSKSGRREKLNPVKRKNN